MQDPLGIDVTLAVQFVVFSMFSIFTCRYVLKPVLDRLTRKRELVLRQKQGAIVISKATEKMKEEYSKFLDGLSGNRKTKLFELKRDLSLEERQVLTRARARMLSKFKENCGVCIANEQRLAGDLKSRSQELAKVYTEQRM